MKKNASHRAPSASSPYVTASRAVIYPLVSILIVLCPISLRGAEEPIDEKIEVAPKKQFQLDLAVGAGKSFGYHRLLVSNINKQLQACRTASEIIKIR